MSFSSSSQLSSASNVGNGGGFCYVPRNSIKVTSEQMFWKNVHVAQHLLIENTGYAHHVMVTNFSQNSYVKVIHYTTEGIKEEQYLDDIRAAINSGRLRIVPHEQMTADDRRAAIERGRKRLGEKKYNAASNNCEHFVNDCLTKKPQSNQVPATIATVLGAIGGGIFTIGGGIFTIGRIALALFGDRERETPDGDRRRSSR